MVWFIVACIFFLLKVNIPDFASILLLGIILPYYTFYKIYQKRADFPTLELIPYHYLVLLIIPFVTFSLGWILMDANPQDLLEKLALFLTSYLLYKTQSQSTKKISKVELVFIVFNSIFIFWVSDGLFWELFVFGCLYCFFQYPYFRLYWEWLVALGLGIIMIYIGLGFIEDYTIQPMDALSSFLLIGYSIWIQGDQTQSPRIKITVLILGMVLFVFSKISDFSIFLFFSSLPRKET